MAKTVTHVSRLNCYLCMTTEPTASPRALQRWTISTLWCYFSDTMATTSLKLPEDVKERAAAAAKRRGVTPHAFMVDAIRLAAAAAERRAEFVAEAVTARKASTKSGIGYRASDVHAYLSRRIQGQAARKPKAKPWRS